MLQFNEKFNWVFAELKLYIQYFKQLVFFSIDFSARNILNNAEKDTTLNF